MVAGSAVAFFDDRSFQLVEGPLPMRYPGLVALSLALIGWLGHAHADGPFDAVKGVASGSPGTDATHQGLRVDVKWIKGHEPVLDLAKEPQTRFFIPKDEEKITKAVIERYFGATGDLVCGGKRHGTANLMCGGRVLTTAAHVLYDRKTCEPSFAPTACSFRTKIGLNSFEIPIKEEYRSGSDAECKAGKIEFSSENDWSVLILERSVPRGIEPYKLSAETAFLGKPLVAVCARSADVWIEDHALGKYVSPKNWSFCSKERELGDPGYSGIMVTNCSVSPGCSGGGLITPGHEMIGMIVSIPDSGNSMEEYIKKILENPLYHNDPCPFTFDGECASYALAVKGEFMQSIVDACKLTAK